MGDGGGIRPSWRTAVLLVAALQLPTTARADQVTVKGDVLHGTVVDVTSETIEIETDYGKGNVVIPYEDVEHIETDGRYYVLHGDDGETSGRLLGVSDGMLLVGENAESAARIDVSTIRITETAESFEGSFLSSMRSRFRYWSGNFDLGYALTQSTVDTSSLGIGFKTERRNKPTRLVLDSSYRYGTQKRRNEIQTTLENEARGGMRGEYDLTNRVFTFASGDAEYDEIERLSIRGVPKAGLGYRFYDTKEFRLQAEAGPAYIYERFFGGDTNDFVGVAFGAETFAKLPYGGELEWRADYLPAIDEWSEDYLLRTQGSLSVPMVDPIRLKFSLSDEYDSTPAQNTDHNKLTTILSVSLPF